MIIDMHTHIFPDKIAADVIDKLSQKSRTLAFTDGTLNELLNSMSRANVDLSVILPVTTNTKQVTKINDVAAALNEKFNSQRIISFAGIHPDFDDYKLELSRVKSLGFKGLKIHPVYQDTNLDDLKYLRIIERAAELDLIVVTHAGLDVGFPGVDRCNPEMSRRVINEIGNFKFVLAHMGAWKQWDAVIDKLADTNVYIDTAFSTGFIKPRPDSHWNVEDLAMLNQNQFMKIFNAFSADRILFGTDCPWSSQADSMKFINQLPISEIDKQKILGENAMQLLKV